MNTTMPETSPNRWGSLETLPDHEVLILAQHTTYEVLKARTFIQQRDARNSAEREKMTLRLAKIVIEFAARSAARSEESMKVDRITAWLSGGSFLLAGLMAILR